LNRLYGSIKNSGHWYVARKIARWLNTLILFILFMYFFWKKPYWLSDSNRSGGAAVTYALGKVIVSIADGLQSYLVIFF